jgi:hypothetical protein
MNIAASDSVDIIVSHVQIDVWDVGYLLSRYSLGTLNIQKTMLDIKNVDVRVEY